MVTRRKGNKHVLVCRKLLEESGWKTDVVELTGRWVKVKDCFGLFDVVAIRKGVVIWIQLASASSQHPHDPLKEFAKEHAHDYSKVQQWVWHDRKGWVMFHYGQDGLDRVDCRR